jgi:tRNA(Ile)-lysidine synthase
MADLFRAEEQFWEKLLQEKFPAILRSRKKDSLILDIPLLTELPLPLRLRCFRFTIEGLLGHLRRVGLGSILTIEGLLKSPDPNKRFTLPYGLRVTKAYNALTFSRAARVILPFEYSIPGVGFVEIPEIGHGMQFNVQIRREGNRIEESTSVALLDFEDVDFPLTVRSFHPGDRFQPLGMDGEKKVKDFFIDCKISAEQRKRVPLLFKGDRLLWVGGIRIDHRARLKPETRRALRVELI